MIVFCTGMPRSASTWSFNACLQLLSEAFPNEKIYADYHERFSEFIERLDTGYEHLILKAHTLDPLGRKLVSLGAAKAVYTHRDPLDAIASYMEMFNRPFEEALAAIQNSVALLEFHKYSGNCCIVSYETIVRRCSEAVRQVQMYLGLNASAGAVEGVSARTGLDAMRRAADGVGRDPSSVVSAGNLLYDRRTLLHKHHIRHGGVGYGRSLLSAEQQRLVAQVIGDDGPA